MFNQLKLIAISSIGFAIAFGPAMSFAQTPSQPQFQPSIQPPQFQAPSQMGEPSPAPTGQNPNAPFNVQMPMALPPTSGGYSPGNPPNFSNPGSQPNVNFQQTQPRSSTTTHSEIVPYTPKKDQTSVLVVKTSEGEFKITFKHDIAPKNVANFVELALGQKEFVDIRTGKKVKRPFYTGLNCHRVIKSVLIQCGCPFGTGSGGPGYRVPDERSSAMRFDRPGVVAMALARLPPTEKGIAYDPNSAGSQFFISLAPLPEYNDQFTVVGQVTSGMETIRKIASTPTGPTDRPLKRVIIFSIDPEVAAGAPTTNTPVTDGGNIPQNSENTQPSGPAAIDPFAAPPPPPPSEP